MKKCVKLYHCPNWPLLTHCGIIQYKGSVFKISDGFNWHFIVTSPTLIDELRRAKEDELSIDAFLEEVSTLSSFVISSLAELTNSLVVGANPLSV